MVAFGLGGTLMTYPVVHLNCTKNPLSHDACISIYDNFFKLVCDTGWFVLVPTGALVSLLFQRQFVFHLIFFLLCFILH